MKNKKEIVYCNECGSKNIVKKGKIKTKFSVKQIYKCKDCNKRFVFGWNKSYPANIVMDSITSYNLGNNLVETSKIIKKRHKVKVPEKTIYSWVKEFDEVCSYYRVKDKAKKLFKPKDIVFKKIFRHLQLYKYRYHNAKIEFFINEYFNGLRNYLFDISNNCPNELFKDSFRISNVDLNIDISKIKIFKKENYACKLASLALESANKNSERHDKLQEFMLVNDTCTIATEVPVYLFLDEAERYGVLGLFKNSINYETTTKNNQKGATAKSVDALWDIKSHEFALKVEHVAIHPPVNVKGDSAITGHIDFVQLKFGSVYVLDYKPDASRVDAVSQLFVYALALSVRTGIWLRNFRCAWFDENGYYEFAPSDIVLRFCKVPKQRVREFFVRNKARRYFTSREFHEKLSKKVLNGAEVIKNAYRS